MHVFISWSGEKSLVYAEELKKLIEGCIQAATAFCSSQDIHNGDNWSRTLFDELASSKYGIICVTKDNISAPWINFEAGAIANKLGNKMTAFLIDLNTSDINSPLSFYQATKVDKSSILNLLYSINDTLDKKVDKDIIKNTLDYYYSQFEKNINTHSFAVNLKSEETYKHIMKILENTNETLDFIKRIDAIMPSITEEIDSISKTDYQKKYDILVDELSTFIFELNQLEESIFQNVKERYLITKILTKYTEIFKKDKLIRRRCLPNFEKVQQRFNKYSYSRK